MAQKKKADTVKFIVRSKKATHKILKAEADKKYQSMNGLINSILDKAAENILKKPAENLD